MNIFAVEPHPQKAAQSLCDKHVVKMVLETAQILSTVRAGFGAKTTYKPTHANHPCTVWARASRANMCWLLLHGEALAEEYTYRYGKQHASARLFEGELGEELLSLFDEGPLDHWSNHTPFALAMPEVCKCDNPVVAYRRYYLRDKADIATWSVRPEPIWWSLRDPTIDLPARLR